MTTTTTTTTTAYVNNTDVLAFKPHHLSIARNDPETAPFPFQVYWQRELLLLPSTTTTAPTIRRITFKGPTPALNGSSYIVALLRENRKKLLKLHKRSARRAARALADSIITTPHQQQHAARSAISNAIATAHAADALSSIHIVTDTGHPHDAAHYY
jgi:hypothetical protein